MTAYTMPLGIIFDMDNTLLRSHIDFPAMKREVHAWLAARAFAAASLDLNRYTTSMLIEEAKQAGMSAGDYEAVMRITAEHEVRGMAGAGLEPGAVELLDALHGRYMLAIVTNNAEQAAERALTETGIIDRFTIIVGRESMQAMKPSPSGYETVLRQSGISASEWLSVGDSWIDGKGSVDAGIAFISYGTTLEAMRSRGVEPIHSIEELMELDRWLSRIGVK
ncbi:HAD-superfamily hydrolase, subfamily IA, variant 1 [Paenibacillus curdlanolyticus YK9]|uniref:HAD-superfamily hydrolase, subfamily IA, variant 1 n=2 Tax=Paenibacillus curdlanolyticus TaxID=59840 RepID=E0ICR2_9BACL|nr:HAD-superfamily hydrolase, subfamily IA, variant 1 [Paenibacillus curdlanolyticus YK9]